MRDAGSTSFCSDCYLKMREGEYLTSTVKWGGVPLLKLFNPGPKMAISWIGFFSSFKMILNKSNF